MVFQAERLYKTRLILSIHLPAEHSPRQQWRFFTETNLTGPSDLNHVILMHIRSYSKCYAFLLMQVQSFFKAKDSQKSQPFFSYEGSSKDPITGSAKLETGKYQEPEEYPMGEWSPSGQDE